MQGTTGTSDILIQAEDIPGAASFYRDVLGLPVCVDEPDLIGLQAQGFRLFIDRGPKFGPVLEFLVPDLAQAKHELVGAGCIVEQEDATIPRCYLRDPYGLVFNLRQK